MTWEFIPIIAIALIISVALVLTGSVVPFTLMESIGRTGAWFHHEDMDALDHGPDPNENDDPIEHRPLRARY